MIPHLMTTLRWYLDSVARRLEAAAPPNRSQQVACGLELDRRETRRRIWHISPGLLPFLLGWLPHADPLPPRVQLEISLLTLAVAGCVYVCFPSLARDGRTERPRTAIAGYAGPFLFLVLTFPAHLELAVAVLAISAFGDGAATLGGLYFRGPTLPWNPQKTWVGTACFVLCGGSLAALAYGLEARPGTSCAWALTVGLTAAVAAAVSESVHSRIDDNLRVGLTAAATVVALHVLTLPQAIVN